MDRYQQKLSAYSDVSASVVVATGDSATKTPIALKTGYSIFIQRILVSVTTDAAQSLTFQDNAGTPVVAAKTKVSPGLGPILYDFGPDGFQLTESKELDIVISGAGLGAAVQIQAYQKAIGVANPIIGNTIGGGTPGTLHS